MRFPDEVPDFVDWGDPVDRDEPLNRGLASWWLAVPGFAGYGSTRWLDLCGQNHGTLTSMDPPTDWGGARGRPGGWGALSFDGTDDYVTASQSLYDVSNVKTVAMWIKRASLTTSLPRLIATSSWAIIVDGAVDGSPHTVHATFGSSSQAAGSLTSANTWYHIAVTANGSSITGIYVDGVSQSMSVPATLILAANARMTIGARNDAMRFFDGTIDDVRIYSRDLSAAEVRQLYADECSFYPRTLRRVPRPRRYVPVFSTPVSGGNGLSGLSALSGLSSMM